MPDCFCPQAEQTRLALNHMSLIYILIHLGAQSAPPRAISLEFDHPLMIVNSCLPERAALAPSLLLIFLNQSAVTMRLILSLILRQIPIEPSKGSVQEGVEHSPLQSASA